MRRRWPATPFPARLLILLQVRAEVDEAVEFAKVPEEREKDAEGVQVTGFVADFA